MIRYAHTDDAVSICRIYNHYVLNTTVTFEEQAVSVEEMQCRIREVSETLPWLVYETGREVAGYAYASRWKSRSAYRFSVESTVYIDGHYTGKGIGRRLYEHLISDLRKLSLHNAIGVIALPNAPSVALHERMDYEKVAHLKEVGRKLNQWIDVGYWELML